MEELLRIYPNDNLSFNIDNLSGENTENFAEFEVVLEKEGKEITKDVVELSIEPGNNYWYFLNPPEDLVDGEYVYTFTGKATKAIDEAKKGSELGHSQKIFFKTGNPEVKEQKEVQPLVLNEDYQDVTFEGENFSAKFSKTFGGLVDLSYNGVEYLDSKPLITFWRPLTDTDLFLGLNFDLSQWLGATIGQQLLPEKYYAERVGDDYRLTFVYRYPVPGGMESAVIYTVKPDGTIGVETVYSGLATVDYLPTFGMNFKLNKTLDAFRYYGYGPEENYIDTTEGLDLNVYESTVKKNFGKKERPQETGNRTGVRWAELYNSRNGKGIRFTADTNVIEFNALPYNDFEIEAASSINDLPKTSNNTYVRIASRVTGVGNGQHIEDWARIDAGEMLELKFSISPVQVEVKKKATPKKKKAEPEAVKEEPKPVEKQEAKIETKPAEKEEVKVEVKPTASKKEEPKAEVKAAPKKEEPKAEVKATPKKEEVKTEAKPASKKEETKTAVKEEAKKTDVVEKKEEIKTPRKKTTTRKTTSKRTKK